MKTMKILAKVTTLEILTVKDQNGIVIKQKDVSCFMHRLKRFKEGGIPDMMVKSKPVANSREVPQGGK